MQGANNKVKQHFHSSNSMVVSSLQKHGKSYSLQNMEKLEKLRYILQINLTSEKIQWKFLQMNVTLCFVFSLSVIETLQIPYQGIWYFSI